MGVWECGLWQWNYSIHHKPFAIYFDITVQKYIEKFSFFREVEYFFAKKYQTLRCLVSHLDFKRSALSF